MAGDLETGEEVYFDLIGLKTAGVCRAATRIGALLSGADEEIVTALSAYGHNLGMAFQIVDDVLSYDGSLALGKPLGSDLRNGRVTLPIIYALQTGGARVRREIDTLFAADDDGAAHARLVDILVSTRALKRARACAQHHTTVAKNALSPLPPSDSRDRLCALADLFLAREH